MALNAYRQLNGNNMALARNLEKLSSGYRINRAGDDAAGLAISEKMRAQIKGLETATKNAQDGISLIQTAEGALTEVHSMLNRMVELATQAANGIYDDQVDRKALDDEFQQLKQEIDRISKATNFNGKNLLDGTLATTGKGVTVSTALNDRDILDLGKVAVPATAAVYSVDVSGTGGGSPGTTKAAIAEFYGLSLNDYDIVAYGTGVNATPGAYVDGTANFDIVAKKTGADPARDKILADKLVGAAHEARKGSDAYFDTTIDVGKFSSDTTLIGKTITVNGKTYQFVGDADMLMKDGSAVGSNPNGSMLENGNYLINLTAVGPGDSPPSGAAQALIAAAIKDAVDNVEGVATWDPITGAITATTPNTNATTLSNGWMTGEDTKITFNSVHFSAAGNVTSGGLNLQIGDTGDSYNIISVGIADMSTKGLGISDLNIKTYEAAVAAIGTVAQQGEPGTIKGAINVVSSQRAALGALQNRLDHSINNLNVTAENVIAAESRIRDTDMAKEMMEYTKNNILVQAAQAMLAQANMVPQGVLQLLR